MDPDGAAKRREHAEREEARVRFWRDNGGACALAAFGLPTDAALAANDAISTRAAAYKAAKTRPGARMDQLRVLAFLDILNGIALQARIAQDRAAQAAQVSASGGGGSASRDTGGGPGSTRPDGPATVALPPVTTTVRKARVTVTVAAALTTTQGTARSVPAPPTAAALT